MSFYRVGQNRRKRFPAKKKPVWDDTVQDLTVHKASPEEILLRKEAHKSKNHLSVRLEKMRKDIQKNKLTGSETQQLAIMKEILYDQSQLQEVLAKSDTMMAVVKDLFGDNPKRFMGFPNVTTAPHHAGEPNSLVASVPDIYTQIEKLSDSLMDQSALNDDLDTFYSDEEFDCPDPISYESKLNLQHFKDYLQEEKSKTDSKPLLSEMSKDNSNKNMTSNRSQNNSNKDTKNEPYIKDPTQALALLKTLLNQFDKGQSQIGDLPDPRAIAELLALMTGNPNVNFQTPTKRTPPLPSERTPPSAMNDTKKIKRSKKVLKSPKVTSESINTTTSMNDMRKVLLELESEITAYEYQTGRRPQEENHKTESFSGYTVALVTAVSRLTRYLKETDLRVQTEVTLREQLTQDVYQLRTIIDALATDLIVTQEEFAKLYSEYKRYREATEGELTSANNQLRELQHLVSGREPLKSTENHQKKFAHPQKQQSYHESIDTSNITKQTEASKTSTPLLNQHDASPQSESESGTYQPLPSHLRSTVEAAVMLSPPVRKTRVCASSNVKTGAQVSKRQTSLVDISQRTHSADPPRLTQTPPVVNTVSVPRPIPLVQSNVSISMASGLPIRQAPGYTTSHGQGRTGEELSVHQTPVYTTSNGQGKRGEGITSQSVQITDHVKFGDDIEHQLQQLQEIAFEEALNSPDMQHLMQSQIAELNRQQEEARNKLMNLLDNQRVRQQQLQEQFCLDSVLDSPNMESTNWQHKTLKIVSPPISPISQTSEQVLGSKELFQQAGHGRGNAVSLPMMNLNDSDGSITSPRPEIFQSGKPV